MSDPIVEIDTIVQSLAAKLCETFFFGLFFLLDNLPCVTEAGDSRGVHDIVFLLDLFHAVSICASCLRFPILTTVQDAKGCPTAQEILC